MSSWGEVLIRIALFQRKTLIETKNRTLNCLKWHYSTVRSIKNVVVLTKDGAFALLSPLWGIWQLKSPHPREFAIQGGAGGGGAGRRWNWLMHKCCSTFKSSLEFAASHRFPSLGTFHEIYQQHGATRGGCISRQIQISCYWSTLYISIYGQKDPITQKCSRLFRVLRDSVDLKNVSR